MASPAGCDSGLPVVGLLTTNRDECSALTAITLMPGRGVTLPDLLKRCVRLGGKIPKVFKGVIMSPGPYNTVFCALAENDKINLWKGLNEFREHLGGRLTITLLEGLGKGIEVHEIDFELVKQAVDYLEKRS